MSEWAVVTVIVTLVTLGIAVLSPIVKLNNTITRISTTVETLQKELETLRQTNMADHGQLWNARKECDGQFAELKTSLVLLERELR